MKTILPRISLFEFCDQPWFRGIFREAFHEMLSLSQQLSGLYTLLPAVIKQWSDAGQIQSILELCSGNGKHTMQIILSAQKQNRKLPLIIASDLFPHITKYQDIQKDLSEGSFRFIKRPVSALNLPL